MNFTKMPKLSMVTVLTFSLVIVPACTALPYTSTRTPMPVVVPATQTAVATKISGLVLQYSTQTAVAAIQSPISVKTPTSTFATTPSTPSGVPAALDWYNIPIIGFILVNLKALAGGGNELIVALVTAIAMLLMTQFGRLIKTVSDGFRYLSSILGGHNKDVRFEHEYLEWLISQHRHLGLLPAQVVARRWGERQQFVELEKIYVRLSLSTQAGDEEWANFSKDSTYRWRRIPGRLLNIVRSTFRESILTQRNLAGTFTVLFIALVLAGTMGASLGAYIRTSSGNFLGSLLGLAVVIILAFIISLFQDALEQKFRDAWLVSDAAYSPGSLGLVVDRYSRLILRGDPGSGKSTLLRYMAVTCARALRNDKKDNDSPLLVRSRLQWDRAPFPILIRLNRYTKVVNWGDDRGLIDAFRDELPLDLRRLYPDGFFERQLKSRRCLILLDAFDELGSATTRASMAEYIHGFLEVYGRPVHRMVVTTRIVGYEGQLDRFGFHIRTVQSLQEGEVRALIKQRYKGFALIEIGERSLSAARAIEQRLMERSDKLIEKVEQLPNLKQLASNPMLLSLIALVSFLKVELPNERVLLYRDCVEILAERWAEYKLSESGAKVESSSGLSLNQKIILLRDLAFAMQKRRETNDSHALIAEKDACNVIAARLLELLGASLSQDEATRRLECYRLAEGWLESIQLESGILVAQGLNQEGETLIGFSHLTFQEYLAAVGIKEIPVYWDLLQKNLLNPAWHEVVLLYSVLVEDTTPLIRALLDAAEQPAGLVLAGRCLTERVYKVEQEIQKKTLTQLTQAFFLEDVALVSDIADIFGIIGGDDLTKVLINAMEDDFSPRQIAAIRSLRNVREDNLAINEIRQKLVEILDVQYPLDVKIAANEALAQIGDPRFTSLEPVMIPAFLSSPNLKRPKKGFMKQIDDSLFALSYEWVEKLFKSYTRKYDIARYPVTNLEYSRFVDEAAGPIPRNWIEGIYPQQKASHPVQEISIESAHEYCRWLSRKTGKAYRLPSECEWEIAAAGPNDSAYPWGNDFDATKCNTLESGKEDTTPVGTYFDIKSQVGLQDTSGNVREITVGIVRPIFDWITSFSELLGPVWGSILFLAAILAFFAAFLFVIFGSLQFRLRGLEMLALLAVSLALIPTISFWLFILSNGSTNPVFVGYCEKGGSWNKPHFWAHRYFRHRNSSSIGLGFRIVRTNNPNYLQNILPVLETILKFPKSLIGSLFGLWVLMKLFAIVFAITGVTAQYYTYRGNLYASQGHNLQAVESYNKAASTNPRNANTLNSICWGASLRGLADEIIDICETAVSLAPQDPNVRDSRGLARALTGDYQGAIEDFRYFAENNVVDTRFNEMRIIWIAKLQLGNNPFEEGTVALILALDRDRSDQEVWNQLLR